MALKIVFISDTHNVTPEVLEGDILIHCGDATSRGTIEEIESFCAWMKSLPHQHKIVIAGNHDFAFEREPGYAKQCLAGLTYLEHQEVTIEGIRIFGSPYQPWFYDWAFNRKRGEELRGIWAEIPDGTDILVTHGPPYGILDTTVHGDEVGCEELLKRVKVIQPPIHAFGHIHEAYGIHETEETIFINASFCDARYRPVNSSIVVNWSHGGKVKIEGN